MSASDGPVVMNLTPGYALRRGSVRKWKICSWYVHAAAKPTTSAMTERMRRTRSSSRCSRNVIRSGDVTGGAATCYLVSVQGGGAGPSRTTVGSAGGYVTTGRAAGAGAITGAAVSAATTGGSLGGGGAGAAGLYFSASTSSSMV